MNFAAGLIHQGLMRIMHRKGSSKQQETTATAAFPLPQDVLASILVRLQGSDLRRLRRVCKEWRDIISDPAFIRAHMVHGPRLPPTHTVVFFPGFSYGHDMNGRGFLFDEHWRLTAELTAGSRDDLIGTCNGLLCFLETRHGSIKIVEPFTGESLAVPPPPEAWGTRWAVNPAAYCFGFDATARRHMIVHHGHNPREGEAIDDQELHVYVVGGGKSWTRVMVHGRAYGYPLYIDGAVYWPSRRNVKGGRDEKVVRFDLTTEKITTKAAVRVRLDARAREKVVFCRFVELVPFVMTYRRHYEWDAWFPRAEEGSSGYLSTGHVLLSDGTNGGLYLRKMDKIKFKLDQRKLLFKVGKEQQPGYNYNGRPSFVPARRHQMLPIAGAPPSKCGQYYARTCGYAHTLAAAPLALYLEHG